MKIDEQDDSLRFKPKGNIGGRDIAQKRSGSLMLPSRSFDKHRSKPELSPHANKKITK